MKKKKSKLWMMGKKISATLLFLVLCQSLTLRVCRAQSADGPKLTVEFKKAPFVEVLNYIKEHSRYDVLYNNEEMRKIPEVSRRFENESVTGILEACLKGTEFTFHITRNVIVIKRKGRDGDVLQEVTLRGKVLDDDGVLLPGATVIVKGTRLGVSTDEKGAFVLNLPRADTIRLVVSFMGMETREVNVTNYKRELVVELKSLAKEVDEVVVTGYGNIRKSSFTGNSVTVKREELLRVSKTNVISALQVFDPSFRIKENNQWGSDPNALPEMQIRGQSGIGIKDLDKSNVSKSSLKDNPNLPVFIMDGFEVGIAKVYDMDPNRIETMTILKDAAATALYGSRAANGVVVITTVAPKEGEVQISYTMVGSVTMPDLTDYNLMHAKEKLEAEVEAGVFVFDPDYATYAESRYAEYNKKLLNVLKGVDTYWLSKPLQTAFSHKHSFYLEGGSNTMRYGLDLLYNNERGVMKKSSRDRTGAGFSFDYRTQKVQVRNYISYRVTKANESPYGAFRQYTKLLPYDEYKDENGKYVKELPYYKGRESIPNPLYEAQLGSYDETKSSELTENLSLNWYLFPTLQVKGELGVTKEDSKREVYIHPDSKSQIGESQGKYNSLGGELNKNDEENVSWEGKVTVSYIEYVGLHSINFSGGVNVRTTDRTGASYAYRGFPSGGEFVSVNFAKEIRTKPTETDNQTRLLGFLGVLNYSYNDIYLLDASVRIDGSSEFGANKRFAPFWAGGLGLNIHNYDFFKNLGWVELLKIRGSFGQTGKVNFSPYAAIPTHEIDINQWYLTGSGASLKTTRGNKNLKWEKTNKYDMGVELGLWDNLIYLGATYYIEETNSLITDVSLQASTGFTSYKSNMGKVENKGFELNFRSEIFKNKDWYVAVYANMAHNTNKIKKISDALRAYNEKVNEYYQNSENNTNRILTKYEEGESLTAKYGMKSLGIDPANGQELFVCRDGRVSYEWSPTEMINIGDENPWGHGAFGVNLRFRGFTLFTSFLYDFGGDEYNTTLIENVENADMYQNVDRRAVTMRWHKPGDMTVLKDIADRDETTRPTSRFMQRKNVLTWNSLSVGYEFAPEKLKKIGLKLLRLEVGANDLWRLSTIKAERGLDYPFANTVNFSLKVNF